MTLHCPKCSYYRDVRGIGGRPKTKLCPCGGDFERIQHIGNGVYQNEKGDRFTLSPPRALKIEEVIAPDYYLNY